MDKHEQEQKIETLRSDGQKFCNSRSGVDWQKEGLADWMLAESRKGITKHSELRHVLSLSQLELRRSREVYPAQGFPEKNIYSGLYRRAYNPQTRGTHSSKATPNLDENPADYE